MFEPGYYKTNHRAIRLREMIRWHGWGRGVQAWIKTRFAPPTRHGTWMPGLWAEQERKPEDLSPEFWQATKPHRADFEKLGFVQCHLGKAGKKHDKLSESSIRDSGAIYYHDPTRSYFGQLLYMRTSAKSQGKETNAIRISFTAAFKQEILSCTNRTFTYDSVQNARVVRIDSYDVPVIYDRFRKELLKRPETPRSFPDLESLRQWSDALKIKSFEERVRRRLFIRMTEPEVAAWWAERQRYPAGRPLPPRRRRFRLEFFPTALVVILLATLMMQRHRQRSDEADDTIEYHGQRFKMRLPYKEYDDYKDDPNNLNTNDLKRIEQTMKSVQIPAAFKGDKEFIYGTTPLRFPGYGQSVDRGETDDGSTLLVISTEIPQAGKERVVVGQGKPGSRWKVVDDFIYAGSDTNDISRVRLEAHHLEYFDTTGHLIRKKPI
jgi:hypothetical protein